MTAPLPSPPTGWGRESGASPQRGEVGRGAGAPHALRWKGLALVAYVMVFEKFIRYTRPAVGLKPSARECEARLRGLERSMYSKTISPRLGNAKPACAGYTGLFFSKTITSAVHAAALHTDGMNIGSSWEGCALPHPPTGWGHGATRLPHPPA